MFNKGSPYNDLPLLPPLIELETKEILKAAISANKALAELKGAANTIPNQSILISTLPLQEARSSSEIENVITTNDKLYEAIASSTNNFDPQTKEVLRYREALWEGYKELQTRKLLTTNLYIRIYQKIKETNASIRVTPGTKISNSKGEVVYSPPEGEEVIRNKLRNLEEFIHTDDELDDLIKMALIHYQFEAIHPFTDGNGRTGRIINVLYLILKGQLDLPILYLSKYIIENKNDYYKRLRNVTEKNEWQPWIIYILNAIEDTAKFTSVKIIQIKNLLDKTTEVAKNKLPSRVYSKELIELIFVEPYSKTEFVVNAGIAKRQTAAVYLKELEKIGLLKSRKVGKEVLYLNNDLQKILVD
ncbi:MAG: Fic family protein [Melioribacteraceae bacterium]|nr:Fic family protein [Melioribacteraceae bacterium]MCF8353353.1 Fic family protein [Melioribacteraceae bacterium]MCF8393217.1 Fic family protein [Melioribacteraceae bacterium]MCF8419079.1 Fic family protein [Melioribacteraceae bacterium]